MASPSKLHISDIPPEKLETPGPTRSSEIMMILLAHENQLKEVRMGVQTIQVELNMVSNNQGLQMGALKAMQAELGTITNTLTKHIDRIDQLMLERLSDLHRQCALRHLRVDEKIVGLESSRSEVDDQFEEIDTDMRIKIFKDTETRVKEFQDQLKDVQVQFQRVVMEKFDEHRWWKHWMVQLVGALVVSSVGIGFGYYTARQYPRVPAVITVAAPGSR